MLTVWKKRLKRQGKVCTQVEGRRQGGACGLGGLFSQEQGSVCRSNSRKVGRLREEKKREEARRNDQKQPTHAIIAKVSLRRKRREAPLPRRGRRRICVPADATGEGSDRGLFAPSWSPLFYSIEGRLESLDGKEVRSLRAALATAMDKVFYGTSVEDNSSKTSTKSTIRGEGVLKDLGMA